MKSVNGRSVAFALGAIMIGSAIAAMPGAAAGAIAGGRHASVQWVQYGCQMFGPYATMRRANEMANQARGYGYSAVAFHNGDGYYVRVC
jgi:hypothetical protein